MTLRTQVYTRYASHKILRNTRYNSPPRTVPSVLAINTRGDAGGRMASGVSFRSTAAYSDRWHLLLSMPVGTGDDRGSLLLLIPRPFRFRSRSSAVSFQFPTLLRHPLPISVGIGIQILPVRAGSGSLVSQCSQPAPTAAHQAASVSGTR